MKVWWLAALVSAVLCWFARLALLRAGVIDQPNARSSHLQPTARGGGLGFVATWILGWLLFRPAFDGSWILPGLLGAALFLAVVSFLDDVRSLSVWLRLGAQGLVALVGLLLLKPAWPDVALLPQLLAWSAAWVWLVGYTNAFNFMDGINGLAALQAVVSAAGMAGVALAAGGHATEPSVWLALLLSGSVAGFVPYNFPRAKMFMGDVGSAPLGFLLAAASLWIARDHGCSLLLPLMALQAGFVLDTGVTLLRRCWRGERIFQAHREHFYQRLVRSGWSHTAATSLQIGIQVVISALIPAVISTHPAWLPVAVAGTCLSWGLFFWFCEWRFRRFSLSSA